MMEPQNTLLPIANLGGQPKKDELLSEYDLAELRTIPPFDRIADEDWTRHQELLRTSFQKIFYDEKVSGSDIILRKGITDGSIYFLPLKYANSYTTYIETSGREERPVKNDQAPYHHVLGEIGAYSPSKKRTATVRVHSQMHAYQLIGERVNNVVGTFPPLAFYLLEAMAHRHGKMAREIQHLHQTISHAAAANRTGMDAFIATVGTWLAHLVFPILCTMFAYLAWQIWGRATSFWDIAGFVVAMIGIWVGTIVLRGQNTETADIRAILTKLEEIQTSDTPELSEISLEGEAPKNPGRQRQRH